MRSENNSVHKRQWPAADIALCKAAIGGRHTDVENLLARGAGVTAVDAMRVLCPIVDAGHTRVLKMLLEAGASPNAAYNGTGIAPLHRAAASGNVTAIQLLLEHGADMSLLTSPATLDALAYAAKEGKLDAVAALLEAGADVNYCSRRGGWSALMWTSRRGYLPVVRLLVSYAADLNACDKDGRTVVSLAMSAGHEEVVEFLTDCGACRPLVRPGPLERIRAFTASISNTRRDG